MTLPITSSSEPITPYLYQTINISTSVTGGTYDVGDTVTVSENGVLVSGTFSRLATGIIQSGGIASGTIISSAATMSVLSSGTVNDLTITSAGIVSAESGGIFSGTINNAGSISGGSLYGTLTVSSAATWAKGQVASNGTAIVSANGSITSTTILSGGNVNIMSLGSANIISNYGTLTVSSGALISSLYVGSTGVANIASGTGIGISTTIDAGGILTGGNLSGTIQNYGTINSSLLMGNATFYSGAVGNNISVAPETSLTVSSGVTISGLYNNAGVVKLIDGDTLTGQVTLSGYVNGNVISAGQLYVGSNVTIHDVTLNGGGTVSITDPNTIISNISITSGNIIGYNSATSATVTPAYHGSIFVGTSCYIMAGTIYGSMYADTSATLLSLTVASGGELYINGNPRYPYPITIASGGYVSVASTIGSNTSVYLSNNASATILNDTAGLVYFYAGATNATLTISGLENGGTASATIKNFSGTNSQNSEYITLAGVDPSKITAVNYVNASGLASADYITFTMSNSDGTTSTITLNIPGIKASGYNLNTTSDGSLIIAVCFLTGSMIRVSDGEIAVEDLRIGDEVLTYDWENNQEVARRITWVGNKTMVVNPNLPEDQAGYPVRVLKNAISEGVPHKDLLVTPEHCLFFDGKFVPVRMLVNGSSIYYDRSMTKYTYYHIETEEHSVIWADGMLTESYLDTGNRMTFKQHGDLTIFINKQSAVKNWEEDANAPLVVNRSYVEPLYNEITQRAISLGFDQSNKLELTEDPDFHLVTNTGSILQPLFKVKNSYSFALPDDVNFVYLKSRTSRPCDTIGSFIDDRRSLGILVGDVTIITNNNHYQITDHLTDQNLSGWDVIETSHCRWTNGNAMLNVAYNNKVEKKILVIKVLAEGPYLLEKEETILQQNIA